MESRGAPVPGIMSLTTSLSKPFARLDKYSNLLKELERHIDVRFVVLSYCIPYVPLLRLTFFTSTEIHCTIFW